MLLLICSIIIQYIVTSFSFTCLNRFLKHNHFQSLETSTNVMQIICNLTNSSGTETIKSTTQTEIAHKISFFSF